MKNRNTFINKLLAIWVITLVLPFNVIALEVVEVLEAEEEVEEVLEEIEETIETEIIEEETELIEELDELFTEEIIEPEVEIPLEEVEEEVIDLETVEEIVEESLIGEEEVLEETEETIETEIVEEETELIEELDELFTDEIIEVEDLVEIEEELLEEVVEESLSGEEEVTEEIEVIEETLEEEILEEEVTLTEELGDLFTDEIVELEEGVSSSGGGESEDEAEAEGLEETEEIEESLVLLEEPISIGTMTPNVDTASLSEQPELSEVEDLEVLYELNSLEGKSSNLLSLENDFVNRQHFLDGSAENRWVFFGDEIEGLSFPLLESEEEAEAETETEVNEPGLLRSLFKGGTQSQIETFVQDLFSTDEFLELYFHGDLASYRFEFIEPVNANSGWYATVKFYYEDSYVDGGDFLFVFDRSLRLVALKQASPRSYSQAKELSSEQALALIGAELAPEVELDRLDIEEMNSIYTVSASGDARYMYEVLLSDGYTQRILLVDPELNQIERVEDLYLFENLASGESELYFMGTYYDSQNNSSYVHALPHAHFHSDGHKYQMDDDGFLDLVDFDPNLENELIFKTDYINLFDDDISVDTVASFSNLDPVYLEEEGRAKLFFQYLLEDDSTLPLQNAYYNLNLIDEYFRSKLDFSGAELSVHVNSYDVDQALSGCSAYYNKLDLEIHLGRGGCGYKNKALSEDILYHEYGHYVLNSVQDTPYVLGEESAALQEAIADYFTASFTDDPNIANDFIASPRDLRNDLKMDDWKGDSHYDSQILSGALWDLREVIGRKTTDKLVYAALYGGHIAYEDFLYQLIIEDDRDLNLADGTPHLYPILWAFERHGIGPGFEAFTQGLDLQAMIDEWQPAIVDYAGEDEVILFAAPDSISLTMTNTGIDFGYIPSEVVSTNGAVSTISVDTDAQNGFEVYLSANGDGVNAGLFDPVSFTLLPSTASSAMSPGVNGFAVYLENPSSGVTIEEGFDNDGTSDVALSLASQLVFSMNSQPSSIESADLRYMSSVSPITNSGNYTESINIFVIGRF